MVNNAKNRRLGAGYNRSGSTSYGSGSASMANYGSSAMSRGTFMRGLGLAGAGVAAGMMGLSGTARAINWGPGPNGEPTYVDDPNNPHYPQVCAFMYYYNIPYWRPPGWYIGYSGILIGHKTVLTCAHGPVMAGEPTGVSFDVYPDYLCPSEVPDCPAPESYYPVKNVYIHPKFNITNAAYMNSIYNNVQYDLAIIELYEPVDITPLPRLPPYANFIEAEKANGNINRSANQFSIAGYGGSYFGEPQKLGMPHAWINLDDVRKYAEDASSFNAATPFFLYLSAHYKQDQTSVCFGDSGGPFFYRADTSKPITDPMTELTLVGVTTGGGTSCQLYEWVSRLDVPEVLDWVKQKLCKIEGGTWDETTGTCTYP